jgi:hypothetical protein
MSRETRSVRNVPIWQTIPDAIKLMSLAESGTTKGYFSKTPRLRMMAQMAHRSK